MLCIYAQWHLLKLHPGCCCFITKQLCMLSYTCARNTLFYWLYCDDGRDSVFCLWHLSSIFSLIKGGGKYSVLLMNQTKVGFCQGRNDRTSERITAEQHLVLWTLISESAGWFSWRPLCQGSSNPSTNIPGELFSVKVPWGGLVCVPVHALIASLPTLIRGKQTDRCSLSPLFLLMRSQHISQYKSLSAIIPSISPFLGWRPTNAIKSVAFFLQRLLSLLFSCSVLVFHLLRASSLRPHSRAHTPLWI